MIKLNSGKKKRKSKVKCKPEISPLRSYAASVEMTNRRVGRDDSITIVLIKQPGTKTESGCDCVYKATWHSEKRRCFLVCNTTWHPEKRKN